MKENKKQKLIIITGPTSVGKTALGVFLAKKYGGEVVSADSIQVYRGFDIGSAKVTESEMQGVTHHLIDIRDPSEEYSAGDFSIEASKAIEEISERGKIPIVVGGTGLYISALLFPFDSDCTRDDVFRAKLENIAGKEGKRKLHEMLEQIDPESASEIHPNQTVRIIRALEIFALTGKKKSQLSRSVQDSKYEYMLIVLDRDRNEIYDSINARVDKMFDMGLVEEVQNLLDAGIPRSAPAMKGIGYKEICQYIFGEISKEESKSLLKKHTRNYAKRQVTFFKKMQNVHFVNYKDYDTIQNMIKEFLGE